MRGTSLTEAQRRVLAVLSHGGLLSIDQISRDAELTRLRARTIVSALRGRGLVAPGVGIGSGRYRITSSGLARARVRAA
ncbi:hypothetical protein NFA_670 [Nocardia farcinica IFM 10152]|uniref:HTH marR-type domain-containing protein n=1 Tax=Nocardia farcinica (strain IFM 10152) TaxID=247156 RepID=Q5Z3T2_NOCFA|nr:hypothetical protein NFA_670 [Nocardia farcinica IFM 10152]